MSESIAATAPGAEPARVTAAADRILVCPAFAVTYPVVFNIDLIGPDSLAAMEVSWARGVCAERHAGLFRLKDVYVVGDGLVFNRELKFIENVSPRAGADLILACRTMIEDHLRSGSIVTETRTGVIAKRAAGHNYGHYLIEMLPLAALGKALLGDQDPIYIVPSATPPMQDVILRTLRLIGIDLNRVRTVDRFTPIHFEEAVLIPGLTEHGVYMSPISAQAAASLGRSVPPAIYKKLFVSRAGPGPQVRSLLNQAEVEKRLAATGFTIVDTGKLTLEQQIALFKGAQIVVGVSGAALTNIIFCDPGTSIVSLVPAHFPDTFFWFIAGHRNLNYMEIRGDQPDNDSVESWNHGFTMRETDIQFLEPIELSTVPDLVSRARAVSNATVVHVRNVGDLRGVSGQWAGRRGSGHWIEAITIHAPTDIPSEQVQYQVVPHDGGISDWHHGGVLAGSRGASQPLLGITVRLAPEASARFHCLYEATFIDGSKSQLCSAGDLCIAATASPLEALRVEMIPIDLPSNADIPGVAR